MADMETYQGRTMPIWRQFRVLTVGTSMWTGDMQTAYGTGRSLLIGYKSLDWSLTASTFSAQCNQMRTDAATTKSLADANNNLTVYIIGINHENERYTYQSGGNADGTPGNTVANYLASWRNLVTIFAQAGVTNVKWVYAPQNLVKNTTGTSYATFRDIMDAEWPVDTDGITPLCDYVCWSNYVSALADGSVSSHFVDRVTDDYNYITSKSQYDGIPLGFAECGIGVSSSPYYPSAATQAYELDQLNTYANANTWPRLTGPISYFDAGYEALQTGAPQSSYQALVASTWLTTGNVGGGGGGSVPGLVNTFEGGSNGVTITAANSGGASGTAWDSVIFTAGTLAYDTAHAAHGSLSAKFVTVANTSTRMKYTTTMGTQTEIYGRFYLYATAGPTGTNIALVTVRNGVSIAARISWNTNNKLYLVDANGTTQYTFTNTVTLNQWTRIEWHIKASTTAGILECKLFNTTESSTATETSNLAATQNTNTQYDTYDLGCCLSTGPALTYWVDTVQWSTVGYPGPYVTTAIYDISATIRGVITASTDTDILGGHVTPPAGSPRSLQPFLPDLILEAGFSVGSSTASYLHLGDATRGLLNTGSLAPDITFTDISNNLRSITVTRGSTRQGGPLITYDAGTLTAVLDNRDRSLDPTNLAGPYVLGGVSQVRPMRLIRFSMGWAGSVYPVFRGYADGWPGAYDLNHDSIVTLTATDAMKVLGANNNRPAQAPDGAGEDSGARVNRILDDIGWPTGDRLVNIGNTTVADTTLEGRVLDELQLVADTEAGELYIDEMGRVVFRNRQAALTDSRSTTSQAGFGSVGLELGMHALTFDYDDQNIVNVATITRAGGAVQQTAQDGLSLLEFQPHGFEKTDLIMQSDLVARDYAAWVVAHGVGPELRFSQITILPFRDPANLIPQALGRGIGDRITITSRPPGGGVITRDVFIRGITHTINASQFQGWQVDWILQDASTFTQFTELDDAILGQLDSTKLAF